MQTKTKPSKYFWPKNFVLNKKFTFYLSSNIIIKYNNLFIFKSCANQFASFLSSNDDEITWNKS